VKIIIIIIVIQCHLTKTVIKS